MTQPTETLTLPVRRPAAVRPLKLTPEVRAEFIRLLALGLSYKRACAALRFSYQTLVNYREKNPEFQEEIDEAVGKSIERSLRRIEKAAENGDVSSDRWLLERRFPGEYGRSRLEVEAVGALEHSFVIPPAVLDQIASARARLDQKNQTQDESKQLEPGTV